MELLTPWPYGRRRRRSSGAALAGLLVAGASRAAAVPDDGPGRVVAAEPQALETDVLTTQCASICSDGAAACLGLSVSQAACEATRAQSGVTCQAATPTASTLCLSPPDAARWTLLLTNNAETLALAKDGVAISDVTDAIVLNASDVGAIKNFELPTTTTQLAIRAAPGEDATQLPLSISSGMIGKWQSLDTLSVRNVDLSGLSTLPALPKLTSLDVSMCRLQTWNAGAATKLTNLDVSSNELTGLPKGSLPSSLSVLNVSSNRLVDIPADLASLTRLSKLSLSHNNLSSLSDFPKLPALKELYLSSVSLSSVPANMANLPVLQVLDLSNNNFAGAMNTAFPASLSTLKLRSCNLKRLPGDFGIDKKWDVVDLSENPFSDGVFASVKLRANDLILDQVNLTLISPNMKTWTVSSKLSLSKNALGAVDAEKLPLDVAELHLADCFLTEAPSNLPSLRRLTILDLSENRLGPVFKGTLPTTLTELYLGGCGLGKVPIDVDSMNTTLQTLDLSGNGLTEVALEGFTGLRQLNLRNNSLTAIPPSVFAMTNLTSLDLHGNAITNLRLTTDQVTLLSKLRTFEIDPSAFAVTGTCVESITLRGKYTVCKNAVADKSPAPATSNSPGVTAPTPAPKSSDSSSSGSTLNIILGCAVALVMIVSVVVARMPPRRSSVSNDAYGPMETGTNRYDPLDMWDDPDLLPLRVDILDIELVMQIGIGAHSVLWLARYKTDTVVVKRLYHKRSEPRVFERFIDEIKFLGGLVHENIVQFIGVSWTSESDLQMLLEFMANGDLHKHLRTTRADESARPWNKRKIRIAMDVARALVYLHGQTPALHHRDLRSHHVLLDESYNAKLTDFGMCRHRDEELDVVAVGGNSSRSLAPEVLSGRGTHNQAVDMYAFGVILAELDSHEIPFSDITMASGAPLSEIAMLELLSTGALQPTISPDCPSDIARLILDCLTFDAKKRPTAREALQRLQVVLEAFEALGDEQGTPRRRHDSYFDTKHEDEIEDHIARYGI